MFTHTHTYTHIDSKINPPFRRADFPSPQHTEPLPQIVRAPSRHRTSPAGVASPPTPLLLSGALLNHEAVSVCVCLVAHTSRPALEVDLAIARCLSHSRSLLRAAKPEMQSEYQFNAEDRIHGPPQNLPERALDYCNRPIAAERKGDDALVERPRHASRLGQPRQRSASAQFIIVETPEPSFVVDSVDPAPCPARHA